MLHLAVRINLQVFLSRTEKVWGTTRTFDTLFQETERHYPTERSRSGRGCAPHFALTHTMELLLGSNLQAQVMPTVCLV